jgi:hypothetical protein
MAEWRYSSTILDLGTRWRWVVSFMPRSLYPRGNSHHFPLDTRLGGPQRRSGHCGEEKSVLSLSGIEPWSSSPQLVVIPTELSRLLFKHKTMIISFPTVTIADDMNVCLPYMRRHRAVSADWKSAASELVSVSFLYLQREANTCHHIESPPGHRLARLKSFVDKPVAVAVPTKARTRTEIVGSNRIRVMEVYEVFFSRVCEALCRQMPWNGPIPHPKNPTNCLYDTKFYKLILNWNRPKVLVLEGWRREEG